LFGQQVITGPHGRRRGHWLSPGQLAYLQTKTMLTASGQHANASDRSRYATILNRARGHQILVRALCQFGKSGYTFSLLLAHPPLVTFRRRTLITSLPYHCSYARLQLSFLSPSYLIKPTFTTFIPNSSSIPVRSARLYPNSTFVSSHIIVLGLRQQKYPAIRPRKRSGPDSPTNGPVVPIEIILLSTWKFSAALCRNCAGQ
jgi:hypothetical protein